MNLPVPSNESLQKQESLWKNAPVWRRTVILATAATLASASLFFIVSPDKKTQDMSTPQIQGVVAEKPHAVDDSSAKAIPIPQAAAASAQTDAAPISTSRGVVAEAKPPVKTDGFSTKEAAALHDPTPNIAERKPLPRKEVTAPLHVQAAAPPVPKNIPALVAIAPTTAASLPSAPTGAPSESSDATCPELLRIVPQTEPRLRQSQVMSVRSADSSLNSIRSASTEVNATIDAKYQYQVLAAMSTRTLQGPRGPDAAVIPADLRVVPGDIVAWDGPYRDQPGRCHYVPPRVRAVLRHEELPTITEPKEVMPSATSTVTQH